MPEINTEVVVLGGGPGGYSAAFRAADLGKQVVLVERYSKLGGACLNVGCIPSKALLHAAQVINETKIMAEHGLSFTNPQIDINKLRNWKDNIINKLSSGLLGLAKRRKVRIMYGVGKFTSTKQIEVDGDEKTIINFDNAIIAVGSTAINLPFMPDDSRIINSTGALNLKNVPEEMLVIGGGVIGLEMAAVYNAFGSNITIVEFMDRLIPGADLDLVKPLHKFIDKHYQAIMLRTKVTKVTAKSDGLWVNFEGENAPPAPQRYNCVLVAVGRRPNGKLIDADKVGIKVDEHGFIPVDTKLCTNIPNIYAIGDVIGNPMLAHKAIPEGRLTAEIIAGLDKKNTHKHIPAVAYTDPEITWVGLTETQAQEQGIAYGKGVFPWLASGRSLSLGCNEGLTKLLFDKKSKKLIGAGIVGPNASELIAELTLALRLGCKAEDIANTIHPHPTLSETIMMSAEAFEGTITDLYMPKPVR